MNVIDFWQKQVNKWNDESKCDFCWEFSAPLYRSDLNKIQRKEECCTYVFLTDYSVELRNEYNQSTGLIPRRYNDHAFNLYLLRQGDLGTNNYNEINGHPIADSNWETIYKPILECLEQEDLLLDFCEFIGVAPNVMRWRFDMVRAFQDDNYIGWKLSITFRRNL